MPSLILNALAWLLCHLHSLALLTLALYVWLSSHFLHSSIDPDYQVLLNASKAPKFSDDPTELECRITNAQNTEEGNIRFTVSWYYRPYIRSDDVVTDELLGTMDADWMLLVGDGSRQRAENGEIIFSKQTMDTFSLRIQWTSETDRGDYYCVISAWIRHRNNSWVKSKDVPSAPVSIFWATQGRCFKLTDLNTEILTADGFIVFLACSTHLPEAGK